MQFGRLGLLKPSVLFNQLLLAIAGETDRQLALVARALSAEHQPAAVLGMAYVRAGHEESGARSADILVRTDRRARTGWFAIRALPHGRASAPPAAAYL